MKNARHIIVQLLLIILTICWLPIDAHAHGFYTEKITEGNRDNFLKNVRLELTNSEEACSSIECFDVNEDGVFAIGFTDAGRRVVQVYDTDGSFLYGYKFNCSGNYSIALRGKNIEIYFVRSDIVIYINPKGTCLSVLEVPLTPDNRQIIDEAVYRDEKVVDGITYYLDRDIGFADGNYARLVRQDSSGALEVLYDISGAHISNVIFTWIMIAVFVGCCVMGLKNRISDYLKNESEMEE